MFDSPTMRGAVRALLLLLLGAWMPSLSAQTPKIRLGVNVQDGSTRVILTHSRTVGYALVADEERVEVLYDRPVQLDPASAPASGTLLRSYELVDGSRLVFFVGSEFRNHESFELRNPFRLVLDLRGGAGSASPAPAPAIPVRREGTIIVLDPGHGGVEQGAIGPTGLEEKDVALDLARRLQRRLQSERGLSVVLTRDEDRQVGLDERTAIANHNRADLFVSIHLNSSTRRSAVGAETYFLSTSATDDEARTLAALENESSGVAVDSLSGADPDEGRGLELVLWDLAQNSFLAESSSLAETVQQQLNKLTGTRDRGVRQAPFRVLMGATMPGILVEVGFISNPAEEERLRDSVYRERVVTALATAVRNYLQDLQRMARPELGVRRGSAP